MNQMLHAQYRSNCDSNKLMYIKQDNQLIWSQCTFVKLQFNPDSIVSNHTLGLMEIAKHSSCFPVSVTQLQYLNVLLRFALGWSIICCRHILSFFPEFVDRQLKSYQGVNWTRRRIGASKLCLYFVHKLKYVLPRLPSLVIFWRQVLFTCNVKRG